MEAKFARPNGPKIPQNLGVAADANKKWQKIVEDAQKVIEEDARNQLGASKGYRLKERALPPQVVGRMYAQYCTLVNRMYEAYLNSVQLQRAQYIKHIINVFVKRMYELRHELIHLILTDYVFVDDSLVQLHLTPQDIEVVVPCHFPAEARPDSIEELLQTMWMEAWERKHPPLPTPPIEDSFMAFPTSTVVMVKEESVHTEQSEDYLTIRLIQSAERHRQWYMVDFRRQCIYRRTYFAAAQARQPAPERMKHRAATVIQKVLRVFMLMKRKHLAQYTSDVSMGIIPDPWRPHLDIDEETQKLYNKRRKVTLKCKKLYEEEVEYVNKKIYLLRKDDVMQDITDEIRDWFKEWYYGYGFFPVFPYPLEGGTMLVVRGDFPTVEEKIEEDELTKKTRKVKKSREQVNEITKDRDGLLS